MLGWWNGIHDGLKIRWSQGLEGSSPSPSTMKIEKKVWPEYFDKIISGEKTFELRLADWDCTIGDFLILKEWDPSTKEYTGRWIEKQITYVLKTKDVHLWSQEEVDKFGFQIISIK